MMHNPGLSETWGCAIGSGSQDLLHKAFQVFTDPGDSILIETQVLAFSSSRAVVESVMN